MNKITYICQLSAECKNQIRQALTAKGIDKEDIETALNSRFCDLESTINIEEVQSCFG